MSALRDLLFHTPWLYRVIRVALGCVFIWAGGVKLLDLRAFARVLSGYDLVPDALLIPAATGLPAIEFLAGLALVFDVRGSLKVISGLLVMFMAVLGYAIQNNMNVDCGCFSAQELHAQNGLKIALLRDLGMMGAALYLFAWRWVQRRSGMQGSSPKARLTKGGLRMVAGKRISMWLMVGVFTLCLGGRAFALEWGTKELDTEKLAVQFSQQVTRGGYKIVTTEELKGWIDKKENMLVVDTMPAADSYVKNHIPGAVSMEFPMEELLQMDDATKAKLEGILGPDKNRKIVFYCGFTKCPRSHNGAMWAVKLGYTDVYRHPGGIKAWLEADYPVEKGK